jgi:hypothetical protein
MTLRPIPGGIPPKEIFVWALIEDISPNPKVIEEFKKLLIYCR